MGNEITTKDHKQLLTRLGFYPTKISDHSIIINDEANNRKIRFSLDNRRFRQISLVEEDVPDEIKSIVKHKNEWFDEFELYRPKRIPRDPFLFGIKDGKYYFICAWGLDAWMMV